jgi:MoxR-like ATPase
MPQIMPEDSQNANISRLSISAAADRSLTKLPQALAQVNDVVLGSPQAVKLTFCCMFAGGHLLIEDRPGVGKTTLANAMAATLGLAYSRIQFTSDLLPADVVGISIYSQNHEQFSFQQGPLFSQLVLADEINRAPPRTQSALLEAMAENQVTVDGNLYALPQPFFVIATQNPLDLAGTWLLPDSQLDRFLLRISLGYPPREAERALLRTPDRQSVMDQCQRLLSSEDVLALRSLANQVHCSDALLDYIHALVEQSRNHALIATGLSPRAGLALLAATRAYTMLEGRVHAEPDDVKSVFTAMSAHRLKLYEEPGKQQLDTTQLADELLAATAIP